jgi:uncharacterized MnhB-related membrane protein
MITPDLIRFSDLITLFLLIAVLLVVFSKKMIYSLIALSLFSMMMALKYFLLKAPDVAITEAALGTGLSTMVFLIAIKKTKGK